MLSNDWLETQSNPGGKVIGGRVRGDEAPPIRSIIIFKRLKYILISFFLFLNKKKDSQTFIKSFHESEA